MSKLTKEEVNHISELARLRLSEEEKEKFGEQLSSILGYVEKLQVVDTSSVAAMAHGLDLKNVTRDDEVKNCPKDSRDLLMNNLPDRQDDSVRVPAVFE